MSWTAPLGTQVLSHHIRIQAKCFGDFEARFKWFLDSQNTLKNCKSINILG